MSIRIGIFGYGNLGKGVEASIPNNPDMELTAVFTRRPPSEVSPVTPKVQVYPASEVTNLREEIDVMILCGGSATDLPEQTPALAADFNVVDSFDTHAEMVNHFHRVDEVSRRSDLVSIIGVGWDPGMFSINRLYSEAILPKGDTYTFWGRGVSQGHSQAVRNIEGVIDARQYTIPIEEALEAVRSGARPELSTRQKHRRECFVVAAEGADRTAIESQIVEMPNYFVDYDTTVNFITKEELQRDHDKMPHGGFVLRSGVSGNSGENDHLIEYGLRLDSNPEFTAGVLIAFSRAAHRLSKGNAKGCFTPFDIAPSLLSIREKEDLIASLL